MHQLAPQRYIVRETEPSMAFGCYLKLCIFVVFLKKTKFYISYTCCSYTQFLALARGEDFIVVPDWLQKEVHEYLRGNGISLHNDEHKAVFEAKPKRKTAKPRPLPKNPGISYMIPGGGTKYEFKPLFYHQNGTVKNQ